MLPLTLAQARASALLFGGGLLAVACTDRGPGTTTLNGPSASISDAVHSGGTAGFYFLPPLVQAPSVQGAFDASLLPYITVHVCEWAGGGCAATVAEFTASGGTGSEAVRMSSIDEHYLVNWHTDQSPLDAAKTYRIRVLVAGTELGHADVDVVDSGRDLRNVNTGEYVALLDGRTLPITLRVEQGAVFVIGPEGGTIVAAEGAVVLRIPDGALTAPIGVTVRPGGPGSQEEGTIAGTLWDFAPEGTAFNVPAELSIEYQPAALPVDIADPTSSLMLVTQEDGEWVEAPTTVDTDAHSVRGPVFGFSVKGVAERTMEISVAPTSLILAPASSMRLESAALGQGGGVLKKRALHLRSHAPEVATVDGAGLVLAIDVGSSIVRIAPRLPRLFPPGVDPCSLPYALCAFPSRDVPVVVRRPVASVAVSPSFATVAIGGTSQLSPQLQDADGNLLTDREVSWTSSAAEVATVDVGGVVTALAVGTVEIQATSEGVTGSAEIDVVPAGFPVPLPGWRVTVVAQLPQPPIAIALAPVGSSFGPDLYVAGQGGDAATSDNIYRVSATGAVSPFAALLPEADPVEIEFAPAGSAFGSYLYVAANNRDGGQTGDHGGTIQRVDASGAVTDFTLVGEASGLTEPRGFAFASGAGFAYDLYVANHVNPPMDVGRIGSSGGSVMVFFEGGLAFSDLEFGRGGAFGTDLYVADWEGCNCLRRLRADATVTGPFVTFTAAPRALHFGPGGAVGTDLYVGAGGTIYRTDAGGAVTPFMSGFQGLGFDGLEFAPDGSALYVADQAARLIYRILAH